MGNALSAGQWLVGRWDNKPAVAGQPLAAWWPRWTCIKSTPGYFRDGIRQLGRQIFALYTEIPIEDIRVMSTLIQPEQDVGRMLEWIVVNGVRDLKAELDFEASLPGYCAEMQIWSAQGFQFMAVKDFAGYYIYAWPTGSRAAVNCGCIEQSSLPRE